MAVKINHEANVKFIYFVMHIILTESAASPCLNCERNGDGSASLDVNTSGDLCTHLAT